VLIFGAICIFALRNRNRFNDGNTADDNPQSRGSHLPLIPVATGITSGGAETGP
jgi:hypothetical protein